MAGARSTRCLRSASGPPDRAAGGDVAGRVGRRRDSDVAGRAGSRHCQSSPFGSHSHQ